MLHGHCHSNHHGDGIFHLVGSLNRHSSIILVITNEQFLDTHILYIYYNDYISNICTYIIYVIHTMYICYIYITYNVKYM